MDADGAGAITNKRGLIMSASRFDFVKKFSEKLDAMDPSWAAYHNRTVTYISGNRNKVATGVVIGGAAVGFLVMAYAAPALIPYYAVSSLGAQMSAEYCAITVAASLGLWALKGPMMTMMLRARQGKYHWLEKGSLGLLSFVLLGVAVGMFVPMPLLSLAYLADFTVKIKAVLATIFAMGSMLTGAAALGMFVGKSRQPIAQPTPSKQKSMVAANQGINDQYTTLQETFNQGQIGEEENDDNTDRRCNLFPTSLCSW